VPEEKKSAGRIWSGIAIAGAVNIVAVLVGVMTFGNAASIGIGVVLIVGFPLVQFAWLLPLYFFFRRQAGFETAKGVLIAAGITVLLSAGCWGVFNTSTFH
jgi:uncharacterized membrane-anchored protein